jgi:hypothetical protein
MKTTKLNRFPDLLPPETPHSGFGGADRPAWMRVTIADAALLVWAFAGGLMFALAVL